MLRRPANETIKDIHEGEGAPKTMISAPPRASSELGTLRWLTNESDHRQGTSAIYTIVVAITVFLMAATATSVVLRRARVNVQRRDDRELYPSTIPDEKEWLASHDVDMLMLDG